MCEVVPAFFTIGFCILEHPGASLKPLLVSVLLSSPISTHTLHASFYFISLLKHVSLGYFRCLMLWLRDWLEKGVVWIKIMPLAPSRCWWSPFEDSEMPF